MKEKKNYKALLTQPQFIKLMIADMINRLGDSLDVVAYSWIMYEITGSEALMAVIIGINYIPTVVLQPIAGVIVDRLNKKNIMIIADIGRGIVVAATIILYQYGRLNSFFLIVLTLCTSVLEAFRLPAGGAFLPVILQKEYFTLGKAANYSLQRVMEVVGYIIVGALISYIGTMGVLMIDVATFFISALIILMIRDKEVIKKQALAIKNVYRDFKEGFYFVLKTPSLQTIFLIGLLINFGIMPLTVFQTPYVSDYLGSGAEMLSYIKILMVCGMAAGAAVTPKWKKDNSNGFIICSGILMGVSLVLMWLTPNIPGDIIKIGALTISMVCIGAGGGVLNVIIGSNMMKLVPKEMLGRVGGLINAIMVASMPISSFICSALAIHFSITQIFCIFGILTGGIYLFMGAMGRFNGLS